MIRAVAFSVGGRYAFSRRSSISFISVVAVAGLALSVAVLVIIVSVVNGFERELERRVFGLLPHLTLFGQQPIVANSKDLDQLRSLPGVIGVVSFVQGAGMAVVEDKAAGILITGIDPEQYSRVSDLYQYVQDQREKLESGAFLALIGGGIADDLGIRFGDSVTLVLPSATVTPAGLFPRQKRFTVAGVIRSSSNVDGHAVYIHEADAKRLFRLGATVHGYQLRLADLFAADQVARSALETIDFQDRLMARSWMRTHGPLYRAIGIQKTTMFVLLSFLVGVAAFNLVSTLVMVVDQRSSDVAILRTLGGNTSTVVGAFVLLGGALGVLGIGAGITVGIALASLLPDLYGWVSRTFELNLMSQYFVSYLPVEVRLSDLTGIVLTAFALCIISTLYPAWRAAALKPSEVLAHE